MSGSTPLKVDRSSMTRLVAAVLFDAGDENHHTHILASTEVDCSSCSNVD